MKRKAGHELGGPHGLAAVQLMQSLASEKHTCPCNHRALYQVALFPSHRLFPASPSSACSVQPSAGREGSRSSAQPVALFSALWGERPLSSLGWQCLDLFNIIPLHPSRAPLQTLPSPWDPLTPKVLNPTFPQLNFVFFQLSHSFTPTKPPSFHRICSWTASSPPVSPSICQFHSDLIPSLPRWGLTVKHMSSPASASSCSLLTAPAKAQLYIPPARLLSASSPMRLSTAGGNHTADGVGVGATISKWVPAWAGSLWGDSFTFLWSALAPISFFNNSKSPLSLKPNSCKQIRTGSVIL